MSFLKKKRKKTQEGNDTFDTWSKMSPNLEAALKDHDVTYTRVVVLPIQEVKAEKQNRLVSFITWTQELPYSSISCTL